MEVAIFEGENGDNVANQREMAVAVQQATLLPQPMSGFLGDDSPQAPSPSTLPTGESGPSLPPELLLLVFEHLPQDIETLRRTCLVSKQFVSISQPYLFHRISLGAPKVTGSSNPSCSVLYSVLRNSPHLTLYIRHLSICSSPRTQRWISSQEILPALLDILVNSKLQSFQMRLSGEPWHCLPPTLQSSIRSLLHSPSLRDIDFTGFDVVDVAIFKQCRGLRRLKFSEMAELRAEKESDTTDAWPAAFDSLTLLDLETKVVWATISWVISTPSFRALRDLRLGFHPLIDVPRVEDLLCHVSGTLESLHFQPVYSPWTSEGFFSIGDLPVLTSLRLSLGIAPHSDPVPWVIFLLKKLEHDRLQHLTIDLRIDDRAVAESIPWAELDSALCVPPLSNLHALVLTLFLHEAPFDFLRADDVAGTIQWLVGEIPRLLPRAAARDVFKVHELHVSPSPFFYWPGALAWSDSEC